jgi:carboxyvinyl-carboxyphosphonate phosphorylmutase
MTHTERRQRLRRLFAGSQCLIPASVYDPISARIAESAGFEAALFSGSAASAVTLAAPDINLLTLSELAAQAARISRASTLSLVIDADHGYGNALNAMRTVQELEWAGAALISLEDTVIPVPYGRALTDVDLISQEEMAGKLRAALSAREDPALMIAGRLSGLAVEGLERTVARARAYAATGVEAIFLLKPTGLAQIQAVHEASGLPLIVALAPPAISRTDMARFGVRVASQGHQPLAASIKALQETYAALARGATAEELKGSIASHDDMRKVMRSEEYRKWHAEFMGGKQPPNI